MGFLSVPCLIKHTMCTLTEIAECSKGKAFALSISPRGVFEEHGHFVIVFPARLNCFHRTKNKLKELYTQKRVFSELTVVQICYEANSSFFVIQSSPHKTIPFITAYRITMNNYGTIHFCMRSVVKQTTYYNAPVLRQWMRRLNLVIASTKNASGHRLSVVTSCDAPGILSTPEKRVSCATYEEARGGGEQFSFRHPLMCSLVV